MFKILALLTLSQSAYISEIKRFPFVPM